LKASSQSWKDFGKTSLRELLFDMEQRDLVQVVRTEKDALAVQAVVDFACREERPC